MIEKRIMRLLQEGQIERQVDAFVKWLKKEKVTEIKGEEMMKFVDQYGTLDAAVLMDGWDYLVKALKKAGIKYSD